MQDLVQQAFLYAKEKHEGQNRKFTGDPYMSHPEGVTKILTRYVVNKHMIAAAYLHDTVEDTDASIEEIEALFGPKVSGLVNELTSAKDYKERGLTKKEYMASEFSRMSSNAFTIKLCDRLHNVLDTIRKETTLSFIKWYWKETRYVLRNLDRAEEPNDIQIHLMATIEILLDHIKHAYDANDTW
jgi:(p)ppGpp synthase/HD superfamily hydrolase